MAPAMVNALLRLEREDVTVDDFRAMYAPDHNGDQVVEGLIAHGFASRTGDRLEITDTGRRALAGEGSR